MDILYNYKEKSTFITNETGYKMIIYKQVHNTIGEPWLQIITNWVSTTGTNSIRGEPQETNLSGLKSK